MNLRVQYAGGYAEWDAIEPFTRRLPGTTLDVDWSPPYLTVMNGAMETPTEFVDGDLVASLTGGLQNEVRTAPDLRLWAGCQHQLRFDEAPELHFAEEDAAFWGNYTAGGPPLETAPVDRLLALRDFFGPWPDPPTTSTQGSARMRASRDPDVMAAWTLAALLGPRGVPQEFTRAWVDDADRWVNRQLKRGQHFYWRDEDYRPWTAALDTGIPYQGYGSSSGGFATIFGFDRPPGFEWESSGDGVCDPQHLALDQLALIALVTRNPAARRSAIAGLEAVQKVMLLENFAHARALGNYLRCAAVVGASVAPYEPETASRIFEAYIPAVMDQFEQRSVARGHVTFPLLDWGSSTDGGHLTPAELAETYELLGITSDGLKREGARSFSTWMGATVITGANAVWRMAPGDADLGARCFQLARDYWQAIVGATGKAWVPAEKRVRYPDVLWDDYADWGGDGLPELGVFIAETGGKNFLKGVGARFIAPALGALSAHGAAFPGSGQMLKLIVEGADGWLAGKDPLRWNLETWTHGRHLGWVGV